MIDLEFAARDLGLRCPRSWSGAEERSKPTGGGCASTAGHRPRDRVAEGQRSVVDSRSIVWTIDVEFRWREIRTTRLTPDLVEPPVAPYSRPMNSIQLVSWSGQSRHEQLADP